MDWRKRSQRRPAINEPGHAHAFTFTCYRRFQFLKAERTCQWLAEAIDAARKDYDFALWAYVFMPEHVHAIIYPRQPIYDVRPILKAMKQSVGSKAVRHIQRHAPEWLERITVRRGKRTERRFWQTGGGYDRNITEASALLFMIEYIHQNPVRRGLVERAEDWKWSSAGWFAGRQPNWLRPDPIDVNLLPAGY